MRIIEAHLDAVNVRPIAAGARFTRSSIRFSRMRRHALLKSARVSPSRTPHP
ncbi:MAG: hypothetical protein ABIW82_12675 [Dokdonella sp.]